jgi:hypothetical protein
MQDAAARCRPRVQVSLRPVARAQMAIWVQTEDGSRMQTLLLTEAVGLRGIGNRPGALQLNSGYRYPYGRRETVLPVWATRRMEAGGEPFRRLVYQDRREGYADRTANDHSPEPYFCLSFNVELSRRDGLDAVSCASPFFSDKGRYLGPEDEGYAQPMQIDGMGFMDVLSLESPYPPRRDVERHTDFYDHPDVARFVADALQVMPELDAVTTATLAEEPTELSFELETQWRSARPVLFVEINTEGDYNERYNPDTAPTPSLPEGEWTSWSLAYGYPYMGQPSVVFSSPPLEPGVRATVQRPSGYARDGLGAPMSAIDDGMTDDPDAAPGSGADRLREDDDGVRLSSVLTCDA